MIVTTISAYLVNLWDICKVSVPFMLLTLISVDISVAFFCCFIFLFALSKPHLINLATIFIISVFIDLYNNQLIGLSFYQFLLIYLSIFQFRILLLNSRIIFGIYFFCLLMIVSEFLRFFITAVFFKIPSDFYGYFERVAIAVFLCCLYCLVAFIKRKLVVDDNK